MAAIVAGGVRWVNKVILVKKCKYAWMLVFGNMWIYANFLWKYQSFSVSRGRKHFIPLSVFQILVSLFLSLSLPTESPSPTVGNTMSQRMAHWHKCHGQLQIYSKIHLGLFFIVHILWKSVLLKPKLPCLQEKAGCRQSLRQQPRGLDQGHKLKDFQVRWAMFWFFC